MLRGILPAVGAAAGAAACVFVVDGRWEGTAIALVGGIGAALLARARDEEVAPVAEPVVAPPALDEVLDAVGDAVLLVDRGRVVLANRAARAVLGGHVVGEDARVAIRHPAAAAAISNPDGRVVDLVGVGTRDRHWAMRVANTSSGLVVIDLHDRTEHAAAERMRVDFVANASHELRTPLASILGYVETLGEEAGEEPAIRRRFLGIMMAEAQRMQRLVEDLISLSRIEADRFRQPDQSVELGVVLEEVCAELRGSGLPRALDIDCATADDVPPVLGDRAQLSQLFHNVIGNAMKYGRAATPVTARIERTPAGIAIVVSDQGDGIAAEHLPRLTERFYRVDSGRSRSLGGTGLGLAIVKHIAERHRGRLEIASKPGIGTTVTITLPVPAGSPPAAGGATPDPLSSKGNAIVT
jgi:two-component system phosphate regulon sensor histidine kinase PhoR